MDYSIVLRMRRLIQLMKNDEDLKATILDTQPTYDDVKRRFALQAYKPWWYLVWRTMNGKGIYIFLDMVRSRNTEPSGDQGLTPWWSMTNDDIWEYICDPAKWFTDVSTQNAPTGAGVDPADDNIGPWHTGDD